MFIALIYRSDWHLSKSECGAECGGQLEINMNLIRTSVHASSLMMAHNFNDGQTLCSLIGTRCEVSIFNYLRIVDLRNRLAVWFWTIKTFTQSCNLEVLTQLRDQ